MNKLRVKPKFLSTLNITNFKNKCKIINCDTYGWDSCVVDNIGGVMIKINKKDILTIDMHQLKKMIEHAEDVENTITK